MAAVAQLPFLLLSAVASLQLVVLMPSAVAEAMLALDQEESCESIPQCPLGQSLVASPALILCDGRCTEAQCCVPEEEPLAVFVIDGGKVTQRKLEAAAPNGTGAETSTATSTTTTYSTESGTATSTTTAYYAESGSSDPSNSTENTSTQTTTALLASSTITETTTAGETTVSSSFSSSMAQSTTTTVAVETSTTPPETPGEGMAVVYSGSVTAEVEGGCDDGILEDDSVMEALARTIAAIAGVDAEYIAVWLRCSRRRLAAAGPAAPLRGLQSSSGMIVTYTITIPPHASGAVTPTNHHEVAAALGDVSATSFGAQLQYFLEGADVSSPFALSVLEIGAVTVEFRPFSTTAEDGPQGAITSAASCVSCMALTTTHVAAAALAILLSASITL